MLKDRLKQARKAAKKSQLQVAEAIGVTQSALSQLETGLVDSSSFLPSIANFLGVDAYWLQTGQGDMHPAQSQRMGDMVQSQGTPVINENFLTQSPRSHALNALINKLDELEQQHLISEDEVSLLKHTLDVLAKSKSSSTNARQPQNPIFKDEE